MNITKFINEHKLEYIKKKYKLNIKYDKDNNYYMINYIKNDIESNDEQITYFSGTILEKDTNKLLYYCKGTQNKNDIISYIKEKLEYNDFYIKELYTGPLIKLFNIKGNWFITTSYHTNAKKYYIKNNTNEQNSKKETLYNLFKYIILEKVNNMTYFWKNLNIEYCYTFIIKHEKLGDKENNLIFLSKYDLINRKEYDNNLFNENLNLKFNIIIPLSYKVEKEQHLNLYYSRKYILIEKNKDNNIVNKYNIENINNITEIFTNAQIINESPILNDALSLYNFNNMYSIIIKIINNISKKNIDDNYKNDMKIDLKQILFKLQKLKKHK